MLLTHWCLLIQLFTSPFHVSFAHKITTVFLSMNGLMVKNFTNNLNFSHVYLWIFKSRWFFTSWRNVMAMIVSSHHFLKLLLFISISKCIENFCRVFLLPKSKLNLRKIASIDEILSSRKTFSIYYLFSANWPSWRTLQLLLNVFWQRIDIEIESQMKENEKWWWHMTAFCQTLLFGLANEECKSCVNKSTQNRNCIIIQIFDKFPHSRRLSIISYT